MKKLIYIFIIMGVIFITSCEDRLDLSPYDGLTDEQLFSNAEGFESAIKGVYSGFKAEGLYGEVVGINISPEVLSDNLTFCVAGRQTRKALFEYRNTAVDESFGTYERGYRIISRANRILDNIDNIPQNEFRDNIEGEALALRAILHFDIARIHCKIPTQSADANNSLGIHYAKSYEPDEFYRRQGTTVADVYNNIINDLETAVDLINEDNGRGRLNKAAVYGLLSRVHLYNGDNNKVIEYANEVIDRGIPVADTSNIYNIWLDNYEENVLFKILVTDQDRWKPGVPYSQEANGQIRSEFVCSYELYSLFSDDDYRKDASIVTSAFSGNMYNHVRKYLGRETGDKTVIDGKYLRMEEVYLNLAEAYYTTDESLALDALNELRENRYENFVSPDESGQALLDAILKERRLELAFEGDRWFTLKRLGLDLERTNHGDYADGTGTPAIVQDYPADGNRWQQPIPQGAIDANPDLKEDQNPGY